MEQQDIPTDQASEDVEADKPTKTPQEDSQRKLSELPEEGSSTHEHEHEREQTTQEEKQQEQTTQEDKEQETGNLDAEKAPSERTESVKAESVNEPNHILIMDEILSKSSSVSQAKYKNYIFSLSKLLVGEQLQLKWIKKGK